MIEKIHNALIGRSTYMEPIPISSPAFAEYLLTFMEQMGMAPPKYRSMPEFYNRPEGDYGWLVHEWEEE
jgi:hypothetical protein